jgi:hypothetical protein
MFYAELARGGAEAENKRISKEDAFLKAAIELKLGRKIDNVDGPTVEQVLRETNGGAGLGLTSKQVRNNAIRK